MRTKPECILALRGCDRQRFGPSFVCIPNFSNALFVDQALKCRPNIAITSRLRLQRLHRERSGAECTASEQQQTEEPKRPRNSLDPLESFQ